MLKRGTIFFLAVCFSICQTHAQTGGNKLLFYHIGEKDGLTGNAIMCFYQDNRGVMWIGTENGLNSFDGSEINTWRAESGTSNDRFFNSIIYYITSDANNTLWVATDNGLTSVDPVTKKAHTWLSDGDNRMRCLVVDGDHIWIATGGGLLLFDIWTKTFKRIFINADVKGSTAWRIDNDCNYVYRDSKKRLWLATVNGLWQYNETAKTFTQTISPKTDLNFDGMINAIYEDHYHKLWIGCWERGLKQVLPGTDSIQNYNNIPLMPNHIMNIAEQKLNDGQYKLWLSGFLTSFDETSSKFERNELRPIAGAAPLEPRNLYVSRDNLLWVATVKGVYILDPERQLFRHHFLTNSDKITNQNPSLLFDENNLLVGGDEDFALKQFDSNYNMVKAYNQNIKNLGAEYANLDLAMLNITPYHKNELLLSTSSGVLKLDKGSGKVTVVCHAIGDEKNKPTSFINNVFITKDKVWAFPWRKGVWQFDTRSNKFLPLVIKLPDGAELKNLNLQDAVADTLGNVWITDLDYGLVKYTASTGQFARVIDSAFKPYTRSVQIVLIKNKLWLTANKTVVEIDPYTGVGHTWPMPANMASAVYGNTADNDGNLLLATHIGLIIFNTVSHSFSKYTEDDGLINNDLDGALYKKPSGEVLYAGENYITSFYPNELLRTPAHKTLLLTGVIAGDTDLMVNHPQKIEIPPGTEKITFKWALLNYTNPLQNRYYYKLDKIDNDWNYAGKQGKGEYNNLPPGTYRFRYKAVTSDGLATVEKTQLFTVLPAFWQTWWFIASIILLLIAGVLLMIRNVRERERKKAAMQLQLSGLEMKALRAQMNPHFIFNALNSIQECIITKNTNTAYSYLSSFSKLVRMILENSEKQFISLEDEIETLRLYLSIEKLRFDDTFDYKIIVAPGVDTTFVRLPAMIVQPFVENALWHGLINKKGEKKLYLSFKHEGNELVCIVRDNGLGRGHAAEVQQDRQIKKQSMGMKITEERLQLLETEASILIKDLKDGDANPCGTEVTIRIPLAF